MNKKIKAITYPEIVREVYDVEALQAEADAILLAKEKQEARRAKKERGRPRSYYVPQRRESGT